MSKRNKDLNMTSSKIYSCDSINVNYLSTESIKTNSKLLTRNPLNHPNHKILLTSIYDLPLLNKTKKNAQPSKSERSEDKIKIVKKYKVNSLLKTFQNNQLKNNKNESFNGKNHNKTELNSPEKEEKEYKKKDLTTSKIETLLKDKYYIDVENRLSSNFRSRKFMDEMLRDRLVHLKKISTFWKGVADYVNPIISIEKFKVHKIKNGFPIETEEKKPNIKKYVPKLYTGDVISKMIHENKKQREKILLQKLIEEKKDYNFYNY